MTHGANGFDPPEVVVTASPIALAAASRTNRTSSQNAMGTPIAIHFKRRAFN